MGTVYHNYGEGSLVSFLRGKGLEDEMVEHMRKKCMRLEAATAMEIVRGNWEFLEREVAVPARKLPVVVHRCPQLLVMGVNERLFPVLNCLRALGIKDKELGDVVVRFPHILTHSVEEKLCSILAFLQGVGVKEVNLRKIIVRCPRLLSYSIERKLAPTVDYLSSLGLREKDMGRVLTQSPNILGYSIENRLRPTVKYLRGIGLSAEQLRNVAAFFPHILCREADKALRPAEEYLRSIGFAQQEISALIGGFPPILTKSIKTSLEPKVQFLENDMGLQRVELVNFPSYFGYSLHRTIQIRFRKMKAQGVQISLSEMLGCNKKQFAYRIGLGDFPQKTLAGVGGEIFRGRLAATSTYFRYRATKKREGTSTGWIMEGSVPPLSTVNRRKQLLFDRRYGWVYEEWTDPVEVANIGGRGMFSLVPLTAATIDGTLHLANFAADAVARTLQSHEFPRWPFQTKQRADCAKTAQDRTFDIPEDRTVAPAFVKFPRR